MAINACENIWCNGNLIPWEEAKLHVMSHVINYGSSVFEGLRCYQTPKGPYFACPTICRDCSTPLRSIAWKWTTA